MIQLQQIHKSYESNRILNSLDLSLNEGENHVIMGSNGAGKTTLARIIAGLEKIDSGKISGLQDLKVMLMQQDFVIWPELTVSKNMSVAADKETAAEWLEKTGLEALAKTKAGKLSHGQKQRLSIARAMAFQPDLLIVDEAFSYLDPNRANDSQKLVLEALQSKSTPLKSVIWITQNPAEAFSIADRLSIIEEGKITHTGTPQEVYLEPKSITSAQLTGQLSVLSHSAWKSCQDLITLPENSQEPLQSEVLAFRPEFSRLETLDKQATGFTVTDTRFHPHGYICHIGIDRHPPIQIKTSHLPDCNQNYRLVIEQRPFIFPSPS